MIPDTPLTKRQLGLVLSLLGLALIGGPWLLDLLTLTAFDGSGPLQRNLALGGLALMLIGISLLPLGQRPA